MREKSNSYNNAHLDTLDVALILCRVCRDSWSQSGIMWEHPRSGQGCVAGGTFYKP